MVGRWPITGTLDSRWETLPERLQMIQEKLEMGTWHHDTNCWLLAFGLLRSQKRCWCAKDIHKEQQTFGLSIRLGEKRCLCCFLQWFHQRVAFTSKRFVLVPLLAKRVCEIGDCNRPRCWKFAKVPLIATDFQAILLQTCWAVFFWGAFVVSSNSAGPLQKRTPLLHRCQAGILHLSFWICVFSPLGESWNILELKWCFPSLTVHKNVRWELQSFRVNEGNLREVPSRVPVFLDH